MSSAVDVTDKIFADIYRVFIKYWSGDRESALQFMQTQLQTPLAGQKNLSVLSVGPGPGDFDKQVIRLLQRLTGQPALTYTAVEPNGIHVQEFEAMAQSAELKDVQFELHHLPIEKFQTDQTFDLIHFTHSMYTMPGQEEAVIKKALSMLKGHGRIVIVITSGDAGMYRLSDKFWEVIDYSSYYGDSAFSSTPLREMLDRLALAYAYRAIPGTIEVAEAFQADSVEGQMLLSFLYLTDLSQVSPKLRQALLAYLDEISTDQDGQQVLDLETGVFVVAKPKPSG